MTAVAVLSPEQRRRARELRANLRELTSVVDSFLAGLDVAMKLPESRARGERIAALANALDLQNQCAKRFGLRQCARRPTR